LSAEKRLYGYSAIATDGQGAIYPLTDACGDVGPILGEPKFVDLLKQYALVITS